MTNFSATVPILDTFEIIRTVFCEDFCLFICDAR